MSARGQRDYFGPIVLIAVGVMLLLSTTGVVPWSEWTLWLRYWPVLVILWGISIMLGGRVRLGAVIGLLFLVFIGILIASHTIPGAQSIGDRMNRGNLPLSKQFSVGYSEYAPDEVDLRIDVGYGNVLITTGAGNFLDANVRYPRSSRETHLNAHMQGRVLAIDYSADQGWDFARFLSGAPDEHVIMLGRPDIPTSLRLDVAAGTVDATLDAFDVSGMTLNVGGGSARVAFPAPHAVMNWQDTRRDPGVLRLDVGSGTVQITQLGNAAFDRIVGEVGSGAALLDFTGALSSARAVSAPSTIRADVKVGAGRLRLVVPDGLGVRVTAEVAAGGMWVDGEKQGKGYVGSDSVWTSPGYDTASVRLDVKADVGAGKIEVEHAR